MVTKEHYYQVKLFVSFLCTLTLILILTSCNNEQNINEEKHQVPAEIITSKGKINIPSSAFMDGRDMDAKPPLTIMKINIWDAVPRTRPICKLSHGAQVEVSDAKYLDNEERYYFKVKSGSCDGWVSDTFISPEKQKPIGDKM